MFSTRFYTGWLLSAIFMYLAFYTFHGVITNDFLKLNIHKSVFLSVAAVVYLIMALGMSLAFKSETFIKMISKPYKRALLIVFLTALFMYVIAFTVGIFFSSSPSKINILVDVFLQIIEQVIGALFIALALSLFYHYLEEQPANFL